MTSKPIRVFYSTLSGRFFATQHYKIDGARRAVCCTGEKYDVTDDIGALIEQHGIEFSRVEEPPSIEQEESSEGEQK